MLLINYQIIIRNCMGTKWIRYSVTSVWNQLSYISKEIGKKFHAHGFNANRFFPLDNSKLGFFSH